MPLKFLLVLMPLIANSAIATDKCLYQSLAELRWQNRLVTGQIDDQKTLQALSERLSELKQDIDERKLLFLIVHHDKLINPANNGQKFCTQLTNEVKQQFSQPGYRLIGLDGGTKKRYSPTEFSLEEVFGRIDLMPMRRAERQN